MRGLSISMPITESLKKVAGVTSAWNKENPWGMMGFGFWDFLKHEAEIVSANCFGDFCE